MCGVVTLYPYCAEHARQKAVTELQQNRSKYKRDLWHARLVKHHKGQCQGLGCEWVDPTGKTLELDHIVALEAGGPDTYENCTVLCRDCHLDKTVFEQKDRGRKSAPAGNPMQQR